MRKAILILCVVVGSTLGLLSQEIIIDHSCTDLSQVPQTWIDEAKAQLRIGYGHTSHGSQLVTGISAFRGSPGEPYYFDMTSWGLNPGVFLNDYWGNAGGASDLGHNGDLAWRDATITMLNDPSNDRNVVIWSWCGGVSDNTESGIDAYLNAMDALETQYPGVVFIYMTGHLDGTGLDGNLHQMNERIRNFCRTHHKILFDFADIESYDPDGLTNFNQLYATDGCEYDTNGDGNPWGDGNWAAEWIAANPDSELTDIAAGCDSCAHSQHLNCVMKGRAFWWMMARIAGWDGGGQGGEESLTLLSPSPGDVLTPGQLAEIRWSSTGTIQHVQLQYKTCEQADWHTIRESTDNDGFFLWPVPDTPSAGCTIRIADLTGDVACSCTPVAIQCNPAVNLIYVPSVADINTIVPSIAKGAGVMASYLVNCSTDTLVVPFTATDENGFVQDQFDLVVPAGVKVELDPATFSGGQPARYRIPHYADACLLTSCESDIFAFAAYLNMNQAGQLTIPHVADSTAFWNTYAYLSNQDRLDMVLSIGEQELCLIPAFSTVTDLEQLLPAEPNSGKAWGSVSLAPDFTPPRDSVLSGFEVFIRKTGDGGAVELHRTPKQDIIIPHIPSATQLFWTGFSLTNPTAMGQQLTFSFYNDEGERLLTEILEIDPYTKLKGTMTDLFPDVDGQASWGKIQCSGDGVAAIEMYGTHHDGICGFSLAAQPSTEFILPLMVTGEGRWTGIAATNPGTETADVTVSLIAGDGETLGQTTWTIEPNCRAKAVVQDLFLGAPLNNTCYIRITASVPLVGVTAAGDLDYTWMSALPMHDTSIME